MKSRAAARSSLGWAFGTAVSILFLALWGRAVVVDTETLSDSLSPLAASSVVADYVADWMSEEMVSSGVEPTMVGPTVDYLFASSAVVGVLDQVVVEMVRAAASTDPGGSSIDMAGLVGPAVPDVTSGLNDLGYAVTEAGVSDVVAGLDPLVIRSAGSPPVVGPGSPTASRLGMAALFAMAAIVVFGAGFVWLSDDRVGAVRHLLSRTALGGLSFAVFLRLGSWVLDPRGGRAPVQATLSAVAGSKWLVPLQIALVTGMVAAGIYFGRRWLRQEATTRSADGQSTPQEERPRSLSGSS